MEHCRQRLARFKCPRNVEFVDELPRQDNGKIYKRLLRDRYRDVAVNRAEGNRAVGDRPAGDQEATA